jgi:hypothetical protein
MFQANRVDDPLTTAQADRKVSHDRGLICTVSGVGVAVPHRYIDPSREVRRPGDRGKLVMSAWLADRLGLGAAKPVSTI